jgi:hypothetical protein
MEPRNRINRRDFLTGAGAAAGWVPGLTSNRARVPAQWSS